MTSQDRITERVLQDNTVSGKYYGTSGIATSAQTDMLNSCVEQAMSTVACYCHFPPDQFPDFRQPGWISGPNPNTNFSSLSEARFWVNIETDDSSYAKEVSLSTSGLSGGTTIASRIQSGIRAAYTDTGLKEYWIAQEITCVYDSDYQDTSGFYMSGDDQYYQGYSGLSFFRIDAGNYGKGVRIKIEEYTANPGFVYGARLCDETGAFWFDGSVAIDDLEIAAAGLAKRSYLNQGLNGPKKSETIGKYSYSLGDVPELNTFTAGEQNLLMGYRKAQI